MGILRKIGRREGGGREEGGGNLQKRDSILDINSSSSLKDSVGLEERASRVRWLSIARIEAGMEFNICAILCEVSSISTLLPCFLSLLEEENEERSKEGYRREKGRWKWKEGEKREMKESDGKKELVF